MTKSFGNSKPLYKAQDCRDVIGIVCRGGGPHWLTGSPAPGRGALRTPWCHPHPLPGARIKYQSDVSCGANMTQALILGSSTTASLG